MKSLMARHALGLLAVSFVGIILGGLAISFQWVRVNVSPSLPLGLYRIHSVQLPLTRGTLVIFLVPGWSDPTRPFLKLVAALEGERVCAVGQHLIIRDEDYGQVYDVLDGHSIPHLEGCLVVPPGHVFLASKTDRSLDSRYYGPIAIGQISAIATPLLTWSPADATTLR